MHNENAEHGKFLRLFPSLLGPRSKMAAVNCSLIPDRPSEPARLTANKEQLHGFLYMHTVAYILTNEPQPHICGEYI